MTDTNPHSFLSPEIQGIFDNMSISLKRMEESSAKVRDSENLLNQSVDQTIDSFSSQSSFRSANLLIESK